MVRNRLSLVIINDENESIKNTFIGNICCVVGKIRVYNNEKYISPEIFKKVDLLWLKVRSLELSAKDKNTILQKAINKLASSKDTSYLKEVQKKTKTLRENTAVLGFGQDWSAGMNVFYSFLKADKTVGFKVGCLDKKMYEETDLIRIAQLPGRGELIGKMLGGMQSPTTHFIHALKFNMQKLVYVLNAKAKQTN